MADDDAVVRDSVTKVLTDAGYDVVPAKDGQEAWELFNAREIGLLVLDLSLPIRDGWDAFERITRQVPVLPIIVVTGWANQYHVAAAAGVAVLLEKPLDAPLLLRTVRELLLKSKEVRLRRLCGHGQEPRCVPSTSARLIDQLREHYPSAPRDRLRSHANGRW